MGGLWERGLLRVGGLLKRSQFPKRDLAMGSKCERALGAYTVP